MSVAIFSKVINDYADTFTDTISTSVVAATNDTIILVAHFRAGQAVSVAPAWNGQTLTQLGTTVTTSFQKLAVYSVIASSSATANLTATFDNNTILNTEIMVLRPSSGTITLSGFVSEFHETGTFANPGLSATTVTSTDRILSFVGTSAVDKDFNDNTSTSLTVASPFTIEDSIQNDGNFGVFKLYSSSATGTGTLTDTYTPSAGAPQYTHLLFKASAGSVSATIDDINTTEVVRVSSTGNTISTTGLGALTTLTIGGKSATSISATGGDGTFSMPAFSDGVAYSLMGTKTATAGDGTNTADLSVSLLPMTGWNYVTLSGTLNTTTTGVLNSFSPAAVVTDQIVFETAKATVDAQGNILSDYDGTQTMWHIKASDGVTRSYSVITTSGVNFNITGLSTTMSRGTITGVSGGVIQAITGLSMTASRGTIAAVSGGIKYLITGLQTSTFLGSIVGSGGVISSLNKDSLPKFLKDAVKAFRKPFSKSFRKK